MTLKERYIKVRKKLFDIYYSALNEKQREAVYATEGPLLVLAGAGSGKTTVLVRRIAHLVKYGCALDTDNVPESMLSEPYIAMLEKVSDTPSPDPALLENALNTFAVDKVSPYQILSITFTNKAANEMKERLEKQLGASALDIWSGTFHSVCAKLLRFHIDRLGRQSTFTIYDTDDQKKLMTSCIKELNVSDKQFAPKAVLNEISRSKEKLVNDAEYRLSIKDGDIRRHTIAKLYTMYEQKKLSANALDFDDMIMLTVRILKENPDLLEKYQNRFKYILVDEYQDTNKAQFVLTSMLCNDRKNIMVVGDDDQSIYKFRGATIENILDFDKVFKNARVVKLEQNYRSTDMIIGAANAVIENNAGRKGKTLWTKTEGGEKITVKKCETQNAEAQYIVDKIGELVREGKYAFSDFAVLYRMNAQSSTLETVFAKSGIPYRILGGTRFYDRKEIKDVIAYLCVISNPFDNVRIKRIINVPKRGIGEATVEEIERLAADENTDMLSICRNAAFHPSLSRAGAKLALFAEMIDELKKSVDVLTLGALVEKVLSVTGYMQMLKETDEAEGKDRVENVKELVSNAVQYQETNEDARLSGFLEEVALVSDIDNYDKEASAVVMMTIHSAKGLEFPVVFLPGLEENIFPGSQSIMEEEELEEERRLCYVAITRAKQRLFMLHCHSRMTYGKTEFNRRSRFVDEIPEKFCIYEQSYFNRMEDSHDEFMRSAQSFGYQPRGSYRESNVTYGKGENRPPWEKTSVQGSYTPKKKKEEAPREVFSPGDSVSHAIFGDGMILSAKVMAGDVLYEVAFDKVGTKKLMGNFAKLTKRV